jgi:hypothetical protein
MKTRLFASFALLIGVFGIACVITQIATYTDFLAKEWSHPGTPWNYLAYFTVLTNLAADFWLISVAMAVFAQKKRLYKKLTLPAVHGALLLYILNVGIIYCGLLFWFIGPYSMTAWWGNIIDMWNHFFIPVFMLFVFWFAPNTTLIPLKALWYWLIFPVVYLIFSVVRGIISGWYPYPFMHPSPILFPVSVVIISCCFVGLGYAIIRLHNLKTKKIG